MDEVSSENVITFLSKNHPGTLHELCKATCNNRSRQQLQSKFSNFAVCLLLALVAIRLARIGRDLYHYLPLPGNARIQYLNLHVTWPANFHNTIP